MNESPTDQESFSVQEARQPQAEKVPPAPSVREAAKVVRRQRSRSGLWSEGATAQERYLLANLRELHAAVESDAALASVPPSPPVEPAAVEGQCAHTWGPVMHRTSDGKQARYCTRCGEMLVQDTGSPSPAAEEPKP